jgi:hypothetical protein
MIKIVKIKIYLSIAETLNPTNLIDCFNYTLINRETECQTLKNYIDTIAYSSSRFRK